MYIRHVTNSLLENLRSRSESRLYNACPVEPGTVVRHTGYFTGEGESGQETDSVTFFSMPYLGIREVQPEARRDCRPGTPLLHNFYGYGVGGNRELEQVLRKMRETPAREALHVSQLWCLTVGSGKGVS